MSRNLQVIYTFRSLMVASLVIYVACSKGKEPDVTVTIEPASGSISGTSVDLKLSVSEPVEGQQFFCRAFPAASSTPPDFQTCDTEFKLEYADVPDATGEIAVEAYVSGTFKKGGVGPSKESEYVSPIAANTYKFADKTSSVTPTPTTTSTASSSASSSSSSACSTPSAKVHLAYTDATNHRLRYATNASCGTWAYTEVTPGSNYEGTTPYLQLDSNNSPVIAHGCFFCGSAGYIELSTKASGTWSTSTALDLSGNGGWTNYISMALDSNNKVHMGYYQSTSKDMMYLTNAGGSWVSTTVDSANDVGMYNSIAIDENNKVHLAFYENTTATSGKVRYATNTSGSWVAADVDTADARPGTYQTTVLTDSSNNAHIGYHHYRDSSNNFVHKLYYATNSSGSWVTSQIDASSYSITWMNMGISATNKLYMVHYDNSDSKMNTYTNASGSWAESTTGITPGAAPSRVSLAVDANSCVHVVYSQWVSSKYVLHYVTNAAASGSTTCAASYSDTTLDSASGSWDSPSIAIEDMEGPNNR